MEYRYVCIRFVGLLGILCILLFRLQAVGSESIQVCKEGCTYQSIQSAIDAAKMGDEIEIAPGTYRENLIISKAISLAGKPNSDSVIIESLQTGKPVISVSNANQELGSPPLYLSFQNLYIQGARPTATEGPCGGGSAGLCAGIYLESALQNDNVTRTRSWPPFSEVHLKLRNVYVKNNAFSAIQWQGKVHLELLSSELSSNGHHGVIGYGFGQLLFFDTKIVNNKGDAIHIPNAFDNVNITVVNSTLSHNGSRGIQVGNILSCQYAPEIHGVNISLSHTTIIGNSSDGILLLSPASLNISATVISENSGVGIYAQLCNDNVDIIQLSVFESKINKNIEAGLVLANTFGMFKMGNSIISQNGQKPNRLTIFGVTAGPGVGFFKTKGLKSYLFANRIETNAGYGIMAGSSENIVLCLNNIVTENGFGSYDDAASKKCQ